jgi:hypothetical protein
VCQVESPATVAPGSSCCREASRVMPDKPGQCR